MNQQFYLKAVVVEAEQYNRTNLKDKDSLFHSDYVIIKDDLTEFLVATPSGSVSGSFGDWLLRHTDGSFEVCHPLDFKSTWEHLDVPLRGVL